MINIFDIVNVSRITDTMPTNGGNPKVGDVLMASETTDAIERDGSLKIVDKLVSGAVAGIVGTTMYEKQPLAGTLTLPQNISN